MTTLTQGNPWTYVGRHRADGPATQVLPPPHFKPKHCAGVTCVHDHHDDDRPSLGWFRSVFGGAA